MPPVKGRNVIYSIHARDELRKMADRIDSLAATYMDELSVAANFNGYGNEGEEEYRRDLTSAAETLRDIAKLTFQGKWYEREYNK